jgi:hypothetical protein
MSKFKGKNSLKTTRLAYERANYKLNAFGDDQVQVTDFNFAERNFYGRVNRQLEPVVVDEQYLVPLSLATQEPVTHRLVNFVANQFRDMELHFAKACRMGVIPTDDPILSKLEVKRSYEDPIAAFKKYTSETMRKILDDFILQNRHLVNNFDQFMTLFMQFYLNHDNSETPILSDFMKSKNSNIFMSGLALDIAGLDYSDDQAKQEQMFNSPAFQYYLNIAKQYGFHVNLNNPGVLISDLQSPATTPYRSVLLMPTVSSVFNRQYKKTAIMDIKLLEKLLLDTYNTYVNLNPYNTYYKTCNNNTISKSINIKNISNIDYNSILLYYINMKNFFEGSPLSPSERQAVLNTARSIGKYDREKAALFVEDQFRRHYNQKHGSLTYYKKRMKKT